MLTNGDTITVGDVVYTWDASLKQWTTPDPLAPGESVSYAQELVTPAIRPVVPPIPFTAASEPEPDVPDEDQPDPDA